jgi:hypothetical protein
VNFHWMFSGNNKLLWVIYDRSDKLIKPYLPPSLKTAINVSIRICRAPAQSDPNNIWLEFMLPHISFLGTCIAMWNTLIFMLVVINAGKNSTWIHLKYRKKSIFVNNISSSSIVTQFFNIIPKKRKMFMLPINAWCMIFVRY